MKKGFVNAIMKLWLPFYRVNFILQFDKQRKFGSIFIILLIKSFLKFSHSNFYTAMYTSSKQFLTVFRLIKNVILTMLGWISSPLDCLFAAES